MKRWFEVVLILVVVALGAAFLSRRNVDSAPPWQKDALQVLRGLCKSDDVDLAFSGDVATVRVRRPHDSRPIGRWIEKTLHFVAADYGVPLTRVEVQDWESGGRIVDKSGDKFEVLARIVEDKVGQRLFPRQVLVLVHGETTRDSVVKRSRERMVAPRRRYRGKERLTVVLILRSNITDSLAETTVRLAKSSLDADLNFDESRGDEVSVLRVPVTPKVVTWP